MRKITKVNPKMLWYIRNRGEVLAKRREYDRKRRGTVLTNTVEKSNASAVSVACLKCGAVFTSPPDARGQYDMFHATRAWAGRRRASIAEQVERGIISADESKRLLAGLKADLHVVADWAGR